MCVGADAKKKNQSEKKIRTPYEKAKPRELRKRLTNKRNWPTGPEKLLYYKHRPWWTPPVELLYTPGCDKPKCQAKTMLKKKKF